jgi:hypothetical protein
MMGPLPVENAESSQRAAAAAEAAGLTVVDLRHEALRSVFNDIGAVVYFLRKVFWTVPDFTVDRYRRQLAELHDKIQAEGPFVAHAHRFLIEARKPSNWIMGLGKAEVHRSVSTLQQPLHPPATPGRSALVKLADRILALGPGRLRVGIDRFTAAGKTSFNSPNRSAVPDVPRCGRASTTSRSRGETGISTTESRARATTATHTTTPP